jgi:ABC-2 type transport system ATP-binding protein
MIKIQGISKEFKEGITGKRIKALERLDLEIKRGQVFGFLGPNGAGKSTTMKILMNLIYPDTGFASIMGMDVRERDTRKHVGYLPENPYFYDYLSAEELLWFGGRTSGLTFSDIKNRTNELLEKVNLSSARKRYLRSYSKGMLQRAGLALALIHDPDVIILDEPMNGLDPIGRKMVGDLIVELKARGKTVFFSSHILTDIERFCDRAGIIIGGKLYRVDTMDNYLSGSASLEDFFMKEVEKAGGGIEA